MKKIAMVTPGLLPVPSSLGGAVENLVEILLKENEKDPICHFTVFSIYNKTAEKLSADYKYASFVFINTHTFFYIITNLILRVLSKLTGKYQGYKFIHKVCRYIKKNSYDYILVENFPQYTITLRKYFPDKKIIQHVHNAINPDRMYVREILETTDEFWCVSNFIRDQTSNTLNKFQLTRTTTTWYNGVDLTRFGQSLKSESIYNKVGFTPDDFICIFTGRIVPYKGIRELLLAFRRLNDYPNIKLLILGSPSFAEKTKSEFNSEIQKLCSELKNKVKFSGYIPYHEIHKYYAISDIAVLPSTWNEPFALTCLEAMASKLPLITTNTGGIIEAVSEDCAIILEKGKGLIPDIAKAIITLYEDPERRERMKEHAFNRSQLFSCKAFFETFKELTDTLTL